MKETALIQFAAICDLNDSLSPQDSEIAWKILASSLHEARTRVEDVLTVVHREQTAVTQ